MTDLIARPRRLRKSPALRAMCEETTLSLNDLVLPIFVEEEIDDFVAIKSMPGVMRIPESKLAGEIERYARAGIKSVMTFGVSHHLDSSGSDTCAADFTTAPAGPVTFTVENVSASGITEVELQNELKILGEKENLAPGLPASSFTVTLDGGTYTLYCLGATPETQTFTVTGQAAASPRAHTVLPSILLATEHSKSRSSMRPSPRPMRWSTFSIQPVPSRQGVHCPQLSAQ